MKKVILKLALRTKKSKIANRANAFSLLVLFFTLFFSSTANAQTDTTQQDTTQHTFYEKMHQYFQNYTPPTNADEREREEGSVEEMRRKAMVWGPRLYPSGTFIEAANAITQYAEQYENARSSGGGSCGATTAHWTSLGPTGTSTAPIQDNYGRLDRIRFDPKYNIIQNGVLNQTVYACSGLSGLWKSIDGGQNWAICNTDYLPMTSVADIAIDATNSNNLFIGTGYADESPFPTITPSDRNINSLWTFGIYRSTNGGLTWSPINDQFMSHFMNGGVVRRLISNPSDPNELFCATTQGIFKCSNALSANPTWTQNFIGTFGTLSVPEDFTSIEYLTDPNTPRDFRLVAGSEKGIYYTNDRGAHWIRLTDRGWGLNFLNRTYPAFITCCDNLGNNINHVAGDPATVQRTDLAVSPANPNFIYAEIAIANNNYSIGTGERTFYLCDLTNFPTTPPTWTQKDDETWKFYTYSQNAIAVSPVNENLVFYGHGYPDQGISNYDLRYNTLGTMGNLFTPGNPGEDFHADTRGITFEPNTTNPKIFLATDGGVSKGWSSLGNNWRFSYLNNGLTNQFIWQFDDNEIDPSQILIANQDCGLQLLKNSVWHQIDGGDGYAAQIWKDEQNLLFYESNETIQSYDATNYHAFYSEENYKPYDPNTYDPNHPADNRIEDHQFKIERHPETREDYFFFEEVYKRKKVSPDPGDAQTPSNLWELESNIGTGTPSNGQSTSGLANQWERQAVEMKIAEHNPNYVYLSTWGAAPHLFVSQTGFLGQSPPGNFVDVTANLPNYKRTSAHPVVTGLAVSTTDEQTAWVTFTGFDSKKKVWVTHNAGGSWQTDDLHQCLESMNLPVNTIVYQDGTDDRVYIGTDAGVYYKDNTSTTNGYWVKFGDIPNVRVLDLKINRCAGKLRAATFGRGVWEADLLPDNGRTKTLDIASSVTWTESQVFQTNLRVKRGATLTIQKTPTNPTPIVYMPMGSHIEVEAGAQLIVDGGIITNSCGKLWDGVILDGDNTHNQDQDPIYLSYAQGYFKMINGGEVSNAYTAVSSHNGGIIQVNNGTFKNNKRDCEFLQYQNFVANTHAKKANASYFTKCNFLTDAPLGNGQNPNAHVTMWNVDGIRFYSCNFSNTNPSAQTYNQLGDGIYTIDANFIVSGCDPNTTCGTGGGCCPNGYNIFTNLNHGVWATQGSGTYNYTVDKSRFINCIVGVQNDGVNSARITRNTFTVGKVTGPGSIPIGSVSIGDYINKGTGFFHSENYFSLGAGANTLTVGTWFNTVGSDNNESYKNLYTNLFISNIAQGQNHSATLDPTTHLFNGLGYRCNVHNPSSYTDIFVTGNSSVLDGISPIQGSPTLGAGNLFTNNGSNIDFWNSTSNILIYFYDLQNNSIPNHNPTQIATIQASGSNPCLSKFGNIGGGGGGKGVFGLLATDERTDLENYYYAHEQLYNQYKSLYINYLDDGNTGSMLNQVSNGSDAALLRQTLLGASPYLSAAVLKEVSNKTDLLSDAQILEILSANPDALRDQSLKQYLSNKPNPLPDWMQAYLDQVGDNVTVRTFVEASLAYHKSEKDFAANNLAQDIMTRIYDDGDSIDNGAYRTWLASIETPQSDYRIIDNYIQTGNYSAASSLLQSIPTLYSLNYREAIEYNNLVRVNSILMNLFSNGNSIMDIQQTDADTLRAIAANGGGWGQIRACNILHFVFGEICPDNFQLPDTTGGSYKKEKVDKVTTVPTFMVYPNPAKDYVSVIYQLTPGNSNGVLKFADVSGKVVYQKDLSAANGSFTIDTREWGQGSYMSTLYVNGKSIANSKVVIAK